MGRPGSYPEFFASRLVCCWWVLGWEPEEVASHWFVGLSTVKRMIARFEAGQERLCARGKGGRPYTIRGRGRGRGSTRGAPALPNVLSSDRGEDVGIDAPKRYSCRKRLTKRSPQMMGTLWPCTA